MDQQIRHAQQRLFAISAGRFALRGAFYAACATALFIVALKFYPLDMEPLPWSLWAIGAAAVLAGASAALAMATREQAAVEIDLRAGLAERLSSALTLAPRSAGDPVVQAVQRDAEACAARVNVRRLFPFDWPWEGRYLAVPLAALLVCHFALPDIDPLGRKAEIKQRKERQALLAKQAAALAEIKKQVVQGVSSKDKNLGKLEQDFDQVADELKKPGMTKPKAMAKLSKLADALQERRRQLAQQMTPKLPRALERRLQVAKKAAEAMNKGDMAEAGKQLEQLAKKLTEGELSPKDLEKLKAELADLAGALQKTNPDLAKALAQAAEKLDAQDVAQAAQKLADAGLKLEELQEMLDQLAAMDAALAQVQKLQKDLGQQDKHSVCRGCGMPLHCDHPLCDAAAGGDCPLGKDCPFSAGFCPNCGAACAGKGPGMGKRGQGQGRALGVPPDTPTDVEPTKVKGMRSKAKPIGMYFTRGAGKAGKSKVKASAVLRELKASAEEALIKERIPQGQKEYIRRYFDTIEPEMKQARDAD